VHHSGLLPIIKEQVERWLLICRLHVFPKEYPKEGCTSWKKLVSKHLEVVLLGYSILLYRRGSVLKSVIEKVFHRRLNEYSIKGRAYETATSEQRALVLRLLEPT